MYMMAYVMKISYNKIKRVETLKLKEEIRMFSKMNQNIRRKVFIVLRSSISRIFSQEFKLIFDMFLGRFSACETSHNLLL